MRTRARERRARALCVRRYVPGFQRRARESPRQCAQSPDYTQLALMNFRSHTTSFHEDVCPCFSGASPRACARSRPIKTNGRPDARSDPSASCRCGRESIALMVALSRQIFSLTPPLRRRRGSASRSPSPARRRHCARRRRRTGPATSTRMASAPLPTGGRTRPSGSRASTSRPAEANPRLAARAEGRARPAVLSLSLPPSLSLSSFSLFRSLLSL